jgi:PKD repeat protein
MRKTKATKFFRNLFLFMGVISLVTFVSCENEEEPAADPIASFQYEISDDNFLMVVFSNFSQNAESYSWNFGDSQTSTDENPTHTFSAAGDYEVTLTATNADGVSANFAQTITITDPFEALKLLTGEVSKTWKLHRVGTSMGVGPDEAGARSWWSLENDGKRPCLYFHEFTFNRDGSFVFDDKGVFWGEAAVFADTPLFETCFEAVASNMVNSNGADVSAWLGGTHAFEYEPSTNTITLNGNGAWMGIPQLGTSAESIVPEATKSFNAVIEQHDGYDLLKISYAYAEVYWDFTYASYTTATEPDVVEEAAPFGEDLEDITPAEIFVTFASKDAADMAVLDTVTSGSDIIFGVDDPLDATADKVGEFIRVAGTEYQELQFRASPEPKDIQFDNFTTVKIDVYVPADTDFTTLKRHMAFGFADQSQTEEWWNSPVQFIVENDDLVLGAWETYSFDLTDVKARADLDMIFLGLGGGGHTEGGTFYVRNLIFE